MSDAAAPHHPTTEIVLQLFRSSGNSQYGGEAVTPEQHALQAAFFAEQEGASSELVAAALLHDVGHLLHSLPDDAPEQGVDDRHETLAAAWLAPRFPPSVVAPVAMHVAAKRYLCAVEPDYLNLLSGPSILSLELQGGPMTNEEVAAFRRLPHFDSAVRVRRWDERAKIVDMVTPDIEHFARYVDRALGA